MKTVSIPQSRPLGDVSVQDSFTSPGSVTLMQSGQAVVLEAQAVPALVSTLLEFLRGLPLVQGVDLPRFQSHKVVQAARICGWTHESVIVEVDGYLKEVPRPPHLFARGSPVLGDYLVRYDDGYVSWSRRKAFEEGYVPLADGGIATLSSAAAP